MTVGKICTRKVTTLSAENTILDAAKLMRKNNIGDVIIVNDKNQPLGIITDRDITIKIVAKEISPSQMLVSDIMSTDLLILKEYQGIQEALDMMCAKGIRRAPIVGESNNLTGIISSDDFALLLSDEIESYGKLIKKQVLSPHQ